MGIYTTIIAPKIKIGERIYIRSLVRYMFVEIPETKQSIDAKLATTLNKRLNL
jgi:hypothetical protein